NVNSYSSSEYFAAALQQVKRGVVYGEITGGLGNTSSQTFNLIDGSAIQVTVGRSTFSFGGPPYPEKVTPDVQLKDDLIELARTGRDLVLERAVQDLLAGK
ncbi:MAG TPA: S41 family peptidase, partial [Deinococcales bacterium]|nr:S41 family peptidase [Deinococcales bacterium]